MIEIQAINAIIDSIYFTETDMSQLIVRNLDSKLVDALKKQAAEHGRSAEAEHRAILADALLKPKKRLFTEVLASMPNVGDDEDFARINGLDNSRVFD